MAILVITVSKTLHSLLMSSYASNFQDTPFSGNHFKFHLSIPLTPPACTTDAESLYNCHLVFDAYQDMKKLRINTTNSLLTMIPDLPKQKKSNCFITHRIALKSQMFLSMRYGNTNFIIGLTINIQMRFVVVCLSLDDL